MALTSTIYRFKIKMSDVERGIYETIELRLAMHPSESIPFLLTRIVAYLHNYQEGIQFTQGLSNPDEPAVWVKDLTGAILLWIEIGNPNPKRLHKASKTSKAVRIYTHKDPENLKKELANEDIFKKEFIEVFSLPQKFLNSLGESLERDNAWEYLYNEGELSISTKKGAFDTELKTHQL